LFVVLFVRDGESEGLEEVEYGGRPSGSRVEDGCSKRVGVLDDSEPPDKFSE